MLALPSARRRIVVRSSGKRGQRLGDGRRAGEHTLRVDLAQSVAMAGLGEGARRAGVEALEALRRHQTLGEEAVGQVRARRAQVRPAELRRHAAGKPARIVRGRDDSGVAAKVALAAIVEAAVVGERRELEVGAGVGRALVAGDAVERDHARQDELALRLLERVAGTLVVELERRAERARHLAEQVGPGGEVACDDELVASDDDGAERGEHVIQKATADGGAGREATAAGPSELWN